MLSLGTSGLLGEGREVLRGEAKIPFNNKIRLKLIGGGHLCKDSNNTCPVLFILVLAVSIWPFNLQSLCSVKDVSDDFCDNITKTVRELLPLKKTPQTLRTETIPKQNPKKMKTQFAHKCCWSGQMLI